MTQSRRAKTVSRRRGNRRSVPPNPRLEPPRLLGLGSKSLAILAAAGITTRKQLEKLGPVQAFVAAKSVEPAVSLNLLWGIAGALTDTHWSKLPGDLRSSLLLEYDAHCDAARALGSPP
jgi:DNA transformation protein